MSRSTVATRVGGTSRKLPDALARYLSHPADRPVDRLPAPTAYPRHTSSASSRVRPYRPEQPLRRLPRRPATPLGLFSGGAKRLLLPPPAALRHAPACARSWRFPSRGGEPDNTPPHHLPGGPAVQPTVRSASQCGRQPLGGAAPRPRPDPVQAARNRGVWHFFAVSVRSAPVNVDRELSATPGLAGRHRPLAGGAAVTRRERDKPSHQPFWRNLHPRTAACAAVFFTTQVPIMLTIRIYCCLTPVGSNRAESGCP